MRVDYEVLKKAKIVRGEGRWWNAQSRQVMELLGVKKPPVEGMPAREVQGVTVWVDSLAVAREKRHFHRVRCACPYCAADVSLGRLHQHVMAHRSEVAA